MSPHIQNFAQLQREVRQALREQHPEWSEEEGIPSQLNFYDARFAELLAKPTGLRKQAVKTIPHLKHHQS